MSLLQKNYTILKKPYITAKSSLLSRSNKHCFIVHEKANKSEIKKMLERLYGKVKQINTMRCPGKPVNRRTRTRIISGKTKPFKKLIATFHKDISVDMQKNTI